MRSRRVAHGCDVLLDVLVLAFAGWTLVYGACLLLRVPADWATAAGASVGLACLALRRTAPPPGDARPAPSRPRAALIVAALLSLFVVRPNQDDAQYVRTATWVAERGTFPVRDILYSDERYEALFFPPWTSIEALHGCVARLLAVDAAAVVYLAAPPLGAAVAVGALWRLLRAWQVRSPALALSTALVLLLVAPSTSSSGRPGASSSTACGRCSASTSCASVAAAERRGCSSPRPATTCACGRATWCAGRAARR